MNATTIAEKVIAGLQIIANSSLPEIAARARHIDMIECIVDGFAVQLVKNSATEEQIAAAWQTRDEALAIVRHNWSVTS